MELTEAEREPYNDGYKAFSERQIPNSCPYLPSDDRMTDGYGEPVSMESVQLWMDGWSDAFLDNIQSAKEDLDREAKEWGT